MTAKRTQSQLSGLRKSGKKRGKNDITNSVTVVYREEAEISVDIWCTFDP